MNDFFDNWWFRSISFALFAAFGGIMGYLMRRIDNGNPVQWGRAIIEGGAAGFVGLLVLFMCQAMHLGVEWTGMIVGVSGWLGANATIKILERVVLKRLGINEDQEAKDVDGGNNVP